MVESGCKHGPFDLRYPVRQKIVTPVWELQGDRDGQRTNRRRHDFEALAAYEAYRNALNRAALRSSRNGGLHPPEAEGQDRASSARDRVPGASWRRRGREDDFSVAGAGGLGSRREAAWNATPARTLPPIAEVGRRGHEAHL